MDIKNSETIGLELIPQDFNRHLQDIEQEK
jgi:hypothetical protein